MFMVDAGAPADIPLIVSEKVTEVLMTVYWDYKIKLSGIQDHQTLLRVTFLWCYIKFWIFTTPPLAIIDLRQITLFEF